jgi:hypothetical protein
MLCIKPGQIKVLSVIEETNNRRKAEKIHCHMRNGYFFNSQSFREDDSRNVVAMIST